MEKRYIVADDNGTIYIEPTDYFTACAKIDLFKEAYPDAPNIEILDISED